MYRYRRLILAWLTLILPFLSQNCNPLYLRLFYNPYSDPALKVDMIAMFNTFQQCHDSYIETTYLNSEAEFPCQTQIIEIVQQNNTYLQQWVHTCNLELDSPSQIDSFKYRVAGVDDTNNFTLVELTSQDLPFILVITANLNLLDDKKYPPFAQAFQQLLSRRETEIVNNQDKNHYRVNGMVINGGFAQHLTANRGLNYNKIMTLLGQYSSRWPLLLNLGPNQINSSQDLNLIQASFVLGDLQGNQPSGLQSYSFWRKADILLLQTSKQYLTTNKTQNPEFQQTASSLSSFLQQSQQQGNDFSIAFNHYDITCDDVEENRKCEQGTANLSPLLHLLTGQGPNNDPIDLYVGSYQDNYQRDFPIKNGSYDTDQNFIFQRGEFISLNQGAGGLGDVSMPDLNKAPDKAIYQNGNPGFGLLTIKGKGNEPRPNATTIQIKQNLVRKIQQAQSNTQNTNQPKHEAADLQILDEEYFSNEDLGEIDLFLLNYKHLTIDANQLQIQDVFRIITQPIEAAPVLRHHLRAQ